MSKKISAGTRRELVAAIAIRYQAATKLEKLSILDRSDGFASL